MSIKPPSDIVLDVARAADPARSVAASTRLSQMAPSSETGTANFSSVLGGLQSRSNDDAALRTRLESMSALPRNTLQQGDAKTRAYQGLETVVLQKLVETMMPDSDEFYGEGSAGMIWKSMLAQEMGADLAKKIDLGLGPKHGGKTHGASLHSRVVHKLDVFPLLTSTADVSSQNGS